VGAGLALLVGSTVATLLQPWPLKLVIDSVLGGEPPPAALAMSSKTALLGLLRGRDGAGLADGAGRAQRPLSVTRSPWADSTTLSSVICSTRNVSSTICPSPYFRPLRNTKRSLRSGAQLST